MMSRIWTCLLAFAISVAINIDISSANSSVDTLIVYESEIDIYNKYSNIAEIEKMISNFTTNIETVRLDEYKDGYIKDFDYVFIINIYSDILNHKIISDLKGYNKNIYWVGDNINSLIQDSEYNIEYITKNNNINKVTYNGKSIWLKDYVSFNILNISNNKKSKELAIMEDGYNSYPYIIKDKNLYYMSAYSGELSYIFEDTLGKFYNSTGINNEAIEKQKDTTVKSSDEIEEDNLKKSMDGINRIIVIFISVILVLFSIIFISFKIINKNKFIRR